MADQRSDGPPFDDQNYLNGYHDNYANGPENDFEGEQDVNAFDGNPPPQYEDSDEEMLPNVVGNNEDNERLLNPAAAGGDVGNQAHVQYSNDGITWKCCYHIYRRSADAVLALVLVLFLLLCLGQGAAVWFDNRWSHGWCVLNTHFYSRGDVDLKECHPLSYVALYSMMWSVLMTVLCLCGTWALQLFANTRWLATEMAMAVLASLLAGAGVVMKVTGFVHWCHNLTASLTPGYCSGTCDVTNTSDPHRGVELNVTYRSCHAAALTFDEKYPQFVSMQSTFWMTLILVVLLVVHVAFAILIIALTCRRMRIAREQTDPTKPPQPAAT